MKHVESALNAGDLAKMIDHTLLRPDAREDEFYKLCEESIQFGFMMVAINSSSVKLCKKILKNTPVHVGAAISFPLGQTTIEAKVYESEDAISNGADEIDYVINIGRLKDRDYKYIAKEMQKITTVCKRNKIISKVIFENCLLSKDEIKSMCHIAMEVQPNFIKTSTGFGKSGATIEDVTLMKSIVGNEIKIKAAGGIRDLDTFLAFYEAGADRIGTSASVKIINEIITE